MSRQPINAIQEAAAEHLKNSIPTNREFIQAMGTQAAVILGELVSKQNLYSQLEPPKTNNKDYFYYTVQTMQKNTGYSKKVQKRELEKLKAAGLIAVYHLNGGKRRIRVNMAEVIDALEQLKSRAKIAPVIPSDDELDRGQKGTASEVKKELVPVPNGSGSNYSLTIINNVVDAKKSRSKETTEAGEHYRVLFHDKHKEWPGKGIGSDRKQANIILKPLITEYGLDAIKKAITVWMRDEWVIREQAGLAHLSKNIVRYMKNAQDEQPTRYLSEYIRCEKCNREYHPLDGCSYCKSGGLRNYTDCPDEVLFGSGQ